MSNILHVIYRFLKAKASCQNFLIFLLDVFQNKLFDCICDTCEDSTTKNSAQKCSQCASGILDHPTWKCDSCENTMDRVKVNFFQTF